MRYIFAINYKAAIGMYMKYVKLNNFNNISLFTLLYITLFSSIFFAAMIDGGSRETQISHIIGTNCEYTYCDMTVFVRQSEGPQARPRG